MPIDLTTAGLPDNPLGMTFYVDPHGGTPLLLDPGLVSDLVAMAGQGVWLRYQLQWLSIETSYTGKFVPVYDWHVLDDAVQKCNQAGVNMCWTIQSPPYWRQSVDPATGKVLPGVGTTCNTTLSAAISAGTTPNPAADGNAVISVVALGSGQSLTAGQVVGLGLTSKTQKPVEQVLAFANSGAGTTQIKVTALDGSVWVPQNSFAGPTQKASGALVMNAGGSLENATDTAQFAKVAAARYNNNAGHGLIQAIQIGNEEFDTSGPRDIQSQWLVPVVNAAAPVIRAAHPSCRIGVCAVRRTLKKGLQHIQNWITNLYTYQGGIGSNADWLDFHYYRDGATAGPDPTTEDNDTPSVVTEVKTIQQFAAQYGHFPQVWCGETGWDSYDDGTGQLTTLQTGVTPGGGPYTQVVLAGGGLSAAAGIWSQIYLDYGNANQEVVYTNASFNKGQQTLGISAVSNQNTAWTPGSNHSAGSPVYVPGNNLDSITNYARYLKSMYDGMRQNGGDKVFVFTMDRKATVLPYSNIQAGAGPGAIYSTVQKGITQTIGGTYTYLAPYTMTQAYAQKYPVWTSGGGGTASQVLGGRFNLQANRLRKLAGRFNLQSGTFFTRRVLSARFKLLAQAQALTLSARFNLQGLTTTRTRRLASRYKLASPAQTLFLAARAKFSASGTNTPPPPDSLPSFFTAPTLPVRFGIGTYQSLSGGSSPYGLFPSGPGVPTHPYAGTYGGNYGFVLDTRIKQPQETQYTPAQEIGLDAAGVSVVRGYPQITWLYTTLRPDYWYYLQWLYRQSARTPPGFQYQVLLQYPSNDGENTPVQVLARMNPPTFSYRAVGAFFSVSLVFQYVGQAALSSDATIIILS